MINDFVPLLELKEDRLNQVCELIFQEQDRMPGGNRIYYFSQKLKVSFIQNRILLLILIQTLRVHFRWNQILLRNIVPRTNTCLWRHLKLSIEKCKFY